MKKANRGGLPVAALTIGAILLASTAGYVSAISRMFQAPQFRSAISSFHYDATEADRAAELRMAPVDQAISQAPAWFVNAMPRYTSSSARLAWYSLLDRSGDSRTFEMSGGSNDTTSYNSFLLFDTSSFAASTAYADSRTSSGLVPNAPTASGSWNADVSDVWSNSANWLGGVIADGAGDTGNFTFNITAGRTITIDGAVASRTLGIMNIGDSAGGPSNYTIAASGGGTLTFDNLGSNAQLNQTSTSGNNTISAPVILTDTLDFTNASANTMTLSGTVTGGGGLNVLSGILILTNGGNTYSGATTLSGGQLRIDADSEPGTGQLNLSGGTLVVTASGRSASTDPVTGNVVLTADSSITTTSTATTVDLNFSGTLSGTGGTLTINNTGGDGAGDTLSIRLSGGDFTMARPIVLTGTTGTSQLNDFNTTGTTHTYNGAITGSGRYNRSASVSGTGGTTVFGANNTYTGTTTVNIGTLEIANTNSASSGRISGTSGVTVNSSGTLLLSGSSSFTDRINDSATMTLAGGRFNTGGLSEHGANANDAGIGALTLTSSSIIDLASGASILAFANSSGATWTGTLSIYNWSGTPITGNGTDQLYFGSDATGLTPAQLAQITFYSDSGTTLLGIGAWGADLDGEVVPTAIPEPSTWIGAGLALAAIAFTQRRRFAKRAAVIG